MKLKGVNFDKFHTWRDFSLILGEKTIDSATPKTSTVEVPGADGVLDVTEYFGHVNYNNRNLSFAFSTIVKQNEFLKLFSKVQNALHGKKFKIILDDDPEFYYVGRVTVSQWKANKNVGELTIDCDCEPYKYKFYKTIVKRNIAGEDEIILENLRKIVNPKIITDSETTIKFNGSTWALSAGTWTLPEFQLEAGKNVVNVEGNGTIIFEYQEGGL